MIGFEVVPVETIRAVRHGLAGCREIVFLEDVFQDDPDSMVADTYAPAKVCDSVVEACSPGMADRLHGVATNAAR